MLKDVIMPQLGAEMTAGRIAEWKKKEGEWVEEKEVVVIVETDKITYEIESPGAGYLHILIGVDEEVPVAVAIGILCESKEELKSLIAKERAEGLIKPKTETPSPEQLAATTSTPRISPLARKLAREYHVDLETVQGSGPNGRIIKRDILRSIEGRKVTTSPRIREKEIVSFSSSEKMIKEIIPLRGIRKVIADRLYGSLQQMAQFSDMGEIDVTETIKFRQKLLEQEGFIGAAISLNDILIKVVATILREMPIMNSSILGEEIHLWNQINIGMAVSLDEGLIVPVIHEADKKTILEIHRLLEDLIDRARNHRINADDVKGGTFTISNFGSYGTMYGTPIINPPQVALLGIGLIRQVAIVINDQIVVGWSMSYSLTMNHQVIDGAVGSQFINRMRKFLANPSVLCAV
jgi:pyruvate/2-oxoglutarate dehydrogenase complex dihydrolipoamide acyltransferase (E2) component